VRHCVWSRNIKNRCSIYIYDISSLRVNDLTLILLTWRKLWTPNNASKWQMGFNSAFKGLKACAKAGFLAALNEQGSCCRMQSCKEALWQSGHILLFLLTSRTHKQKFFVGEEKRWLFCALRKYVILYLEMWFNGAGSLNYHRGINVENFEYFIVAREGKIWYYYYFFVHNSSVPALS